MGVGAQTEDPVLMTVNGKDITRSEFEYSYNKNNSEGVIDKKTLEEYVPLFVNFKLKVAAAEEAKIDTMSSIVKELRDYREQLVLPTIVDSDYVEQRARETYNSTAKRFEGYEGVHCNAHMSSKMIRKYCVLDDKCIAMLNKAMDKYGLSARAYDKILKVARTIADLAGAEDIAVPHLLEAINYRNLDKAGWVN